MRRHFILLSAAACLLGCGPAPGDQFPKSLKRRSNMNEECIGRFRLDVPDNLKITGRSQSIYGVSVRTEPVRDSSVARQWETRLTVIGKLPAAGGRQSPVLSQPELERGVAGVFYNSSPASPSVVTLEAAQAAGDHGFWVTYTGTAGKEPGIQKLVRNVMTAYGPGTAHGFCAGAGSVRMGPSLSETVNMTLGPRAAGGIKLEFETKTVTEPDHKFMDAAEGGEFAAATGGTFSVLMDRERTIAGLAGREVRVSMTLPGKAPLLKYGWHFAGVGRDATKPSISFFGQADADAQPELDAAWEVVIPSLRPVPVEPPR